MGFAALHFTTKASPVWALVSRALNSMRQKLYLYFRFFIYGLLSFSLLGVFLEVPIAGLHDISYKLVVYLGLAGGLSMMLSSIAANILFVFIKDLIYGNT